MAKLNHYGIREVPNDCFKSYVSNRKQYVSMNGYESNNAAINCGVCQRSVLGYDLIYSPIKLKQLSVIFFLNHISKSLIMQKVFMTLLVYNHLEELFQLLIPVHVLDFCFLHYFLSFDSKAMTVHKVSSLHISFLKTFNKRRLNLSFNE